MPCFGPAYLHFSSLQTQQYFGKILMSVESELVPSEVEQIEKLKIDSVASIPDEVIIITRSERMKTFVYTSLTVYMYLFGLNQNCMYTHKHMYE